MIEIDGRAYTPEEKHALLARLETLWLANPELRLGQLIVAGCGVMMLFYVEDETFITSLEDEFSKEK